MKKNPFISVLVLGLAILLFCSCSKSNGDKKENPTSIADEIILLQVTDCLKDFDFLVEKIKTNYPGYNDKVTNENRSQLVLLEKEIRQKITNHPDSCFEYLKEYTNFFKDGHFYVYRNLSDSTENNIRLDTMDISTYGKNLHINVDSLQTATKNSKGIEGVWTAYKREFAVTKDGKKYVGVVVNNEDWKNGQVMLEFKPVNDSVFDVINHSLIKNKKPFETKASLHLNGKIIDFHNDKKYVRKSDFPVFDRTVLSSYESEYPNINIYRSSSFMAFCLDENTFFLRIPTFSNNNANELVRKHLKEITSHPNLIIDVRSNGGGSIGNFWELQKIIYTKPYELKGFEYYATEDYIKFIEDMINKGEIPKNNIKGWQDFIEEVKKNIGSFIPPQGSTGNNSDTIRMNTVYAMPRNVGIIADKNSVSAAEYFLLAAKESDKVITFGSSSAGILDYGSAIPIPLPSNRYILRCPTMRSKRLPENPLDNIGIAPDFVIPFPQINYLDDKLDSWVYFVKKYLEFLNDEKKQ